jgi:hypothetical protein
MQLRGFRTMNALWGIMYPHCRVAVSLTRTISCDTDLRGSIGLCLLVRRKWDMLVLITGIIRESYPSWLQHSHKGTRDEQLHNASAEPPPSKTSFCALARVTSSHCLMLMHAFAFAGRPPCSSYLAATCSAQLYFGLSCKGSIDAQSDPRIRMEKSQYIIGTIVGVGYRPIGWLIDKVCWPMLSWRVNSWRRFLEVWGQ